MPGHVDSMNAITLVTAEMAASVAFYGVLGAEVVFGGPQNSFTTLRLNDSQFLNLQLDSTWTKPERVWGRFILWVDHVDVVYAAFIAAGYSPSMAPSDAVWGERYFHIVDPAGHEVSIARRLDA
jgi:catechol 2,3-dioxygenase-like lactoylglutathione lyase family enzyme